jgi:hypothetical protein
VSVFIGFEFDPNTTSPHVLGGNEFDHVLKNYLHDAKGRIEVTTTHASNDFHVLDVNINFSLVQEVMSK